MSTPRRRSLFGRKLNTRDQATKSLVDPQRDGSHEGAASVTAPRRDVLSWASSNGLTVEPMEADSYANVVVHPEPIPVRTDGRLNDPRDVTIGLYRHPHFGSVYASEMMPLDDGSWAPINAAAGKNDGMAHMTGSVDAGRLTYAGMEIITGGRHGRIPVSVTEPIYRDLEKRISEIPFEPTWDQELPPEWDPEHPREPAPDDAAPHPLLAAVGKVLDKPAHEPATTSAAPPSVRARSTTSTFSTSDIDHEDDGPDF